MYITTSGQGKYKIVQLKEDVRLPGTDKKTTKVLHNYGKYNNLFAEDPDFMQKLRADARRATLEKKESLRPLTLEVSSSPIGQTDDVTPSFRFGHAIVKQLWDMLRLDSFFEKHCGKRNSKAVLEALYYLTAHRLFAPDSIRATALEQDSYAGITPVGLDVFYDVLDILAEQKDALIKHLGKVFERKTKREQAHAYYDVTTYAFESTKWGELRIFGFSKDHKNNEVQVVMGLLIDSNWIPLNYELFAGNTMDQNTLQNSVESLRKLYGLDEITVVADRGLNGGENLDFLKGNNHHFVIGYTLKRSKQEFKDLVFDDTDWAMETVDEDTGEVVYRSKVIEQVLKVKVLLTEDELAEEAKMKKRGRKRKYKEKEIKGYTHLTWSAKRAAKDALDRERILERLRKKLDKPSQIKAAMKRGGNQYLQFDFDGTDCQIDEERVREAAKYDGYYAVITDRGELNTKEVMDIYRGLWRIEESFRILKSDIAARPVFVWTDDHIKGHFVMCYLSLCIIRYIQYLLAEKREPVLSAEEIMKAIHRPLALAQGAYPRMIITPTEVPESYLTISRILELPELLTNMTITNFRARTKLDLNQNLKPI